MESTEDDTTGFDLQSTTLEIPGFALLAVERETERFQVWRAREIALDRDVAITVLKLEFSSDLAVRSDFLRAARSKSKVHHPGVIPVYQVGQTDLGQPFFVSPMVEGIRWSQLIRRLPLEKNLQILIKVAGIVGQAHRCEMLHRDLRPESVLLGEAHAVYLEDWDIAISTSEDATLEEFNFAGTPAYMSPEMATGPMSAMTTRSDIYQLGAILFEILTGRPPHRGASALQCLQAAANNEIRAFDAAAIARRDPTGQLLSIAKQAMATLMLERPATAEAFEARIRDYEVHADSIRLVQRATRQREAADRAQMMSELRVAILDFEEALRLWPENQPASTGLALAKAEFERLSQDRLRLRRRFVLALLMVFVGELMLGWAIPHVMAS